MNASQSALEEGLTPRSTAVLERVKEQVDSIIYKSWKQNKSGVAKVASFEAWRILKETAGETAAPLLLAAGPIVNGKAEGPLARIHTTDVAATTALGGLGVFLLSAPFLWDMLATHAPVGGMRQKMVREAYRSATGNDPNALTEHALDEICELISRDKVAVAAVLFNLACGDFLAWDWPTALATSACAAVSLGLPRLPRYRLEKLERRGVAA